MFGRVVRLLAVVVVSTWLSGTAFGQCGTERWPVKIGTDADASKVNTAAVLPTTIAALRSIPAPRPLPQSQRMSPVETTVYSVTATLTDFKLEDDSDYHLVLSDSSGQTMIVEIPSPGCVGSSPFAQSVAAARAMFDAHFTAISSFQRAGVPVEVRGVGFFDFLHAQRGVAPNGIELHPVTFITFSPVVQPIPPLFLSRRRAVSPGSGGGMNCTPPTFRLTVSKSVVCSGESFTLVWEASDLAATVAIDGIGSALPAVGSTAVGTTSSTAYSGRAANTCGVSTESVAEVSVVSVANASLTPSAVSVQQNSSITLSIFVSGAGSWSISSALGNTISPSSGVSGTITATYTASRTGTDTVTLTAAGGCGTIQQSTTIIVSSAPPPPPPAGLLCCDGTRSPSCFSCASKSGCCSHHGGVCGC